MPQVINTNVASLNAQRNLNTSQSSLATALQRLSSGLRINSAKDDAAGLAISDRFTTQIRGLNQATRNANDGISLAQTGEGALAEITNNLQRIRELAVQAANATNSSSDRAALDLEVQQRIAEIDRTAVQTSFNGQKILDGTFGTATFQVGANVSETISIGLQTSMRTTALGQSADYAGATAVYDSAKALGAQGAGVNTTVLAANTVSIAVGGNAAVSILGSANYASATPTDGRSNTSAYAKAAAINASGVTGLTATADTTATFAFTTVNAASYSFTVNGQPIASAENFSTDSLTASEFVQRLNNVSGATGVTAAFDSGTGRVTLNAADGRDIIITQDDGGAAGSAVGLQLPAGANNTVNAALNPTTGNTFTAAGSIRLQAAGQITLADSGAGGADELGYVAGALSAAGALNSVSVTTVANANTAISRIDSALTAVSSFRSTFGAIQNRFESTIANLQTTSENLSASRSRIQDADFAAETANLTRAQILQQSGIAMLGQANALPNNVLSLLRG